MVDNSDRRGVLRTIRSILVATFVCAEEDFVRNGVVVTEAGELPGRIRFPLSSKPLTVVTMGAGVVMSCHAERVGWVRANLASLPRDEIFSGSVIGRLARQIERDGQILIGPHLKHTCARSDFRPAPVPAGVEVTLVEGKDVIDLYKYQGFGIAMSYRPDSPRPDVMATVATRRGAVVGIAAASADSDELWQIGVEVSGHERGGGIGQALVGRLTEGILAAGKIPYYGTAVSNLPSRLVANRLGFWPVWTEMYARDRSE
jgi:hypothetical protein